MIFYVYITIIYGSEMADGNTQGFPQERREQNAFLPHLHIQSCRHVFRRPRQGLHFSGLSLPSIIYTASRANVWDFENGRRWESDAFLLRREDELAAL